MKRFSTLALGVAGVLAAAAAAPAARAQASATAPTTSTATIFQPIQLAKNTDLSFGTVVRPITGSGTVAISASDGQRTPSGGVALLNTGPNAPASRATYTVTGEGGQTFNVNIPANFSMSRTGGSESILVTLNMSVTNPQTLSGTLGNTGSLTFGVGGSIPVASNTQSGAYSGTFNVVVAYN
jgi:spore coat protein U-like protein